MEPHQFGHQSTAICLRIFHFGLEFVQRVLSFMLLNTKPYLTRIYWEDGVDGIRSSYWLSQIYLAKKFAN
jgi:hypothetical protein